jgi:ElaB/YqjD/DUF883 family membrane-anchored ribosome-binding protein
MQTAEHSTNHDHDFSTLLEDARALVAATAEVAGDKIVEARRRLATALDSSRRAYEQVKAKTIAGAKATDEVVRQHPYRAMGVALGAGLLIGFLLRRRSGSHA